MTTQTGIRVYNDGGQLIISDATTTFYYYGPAELAQVVGSGVDSGVTIRTYNSYSSAPIIPFVYPHSSDLVAITRIYRNYSGYWFLEVAQGGLDAPAPEIIIFTTPDAENWNSRFYRGDRSHGVKVKRSDGSTSFDSSVGQPLAVRAAFDVIPPYNPNVGGQDLKPVYYNPYNIDPSISQPMFGYYSMALAEREFTAYQYSRQCTGIDAYGACIGFTDVTSRVDRYWSFYHAAMGWNGSTLNCGWVEYSNGHVWSSSSSSGFDVFIPILDLGGGNAQGGTPPFVTATINYSGQKVLVVDKAMYPGTNYTYTPPIPNAPSNLLVQTQINASGKNILVADWQNSPTYPFAITYNVYVRRTGTSQWYFVGATNKSNASGGAPYYDFPPTATLQAGQTLYHDNWLYSNNRQFFLVAQSDGNVVIYRTTNGGPPYNPIWQSYTNTPAGFQPVRIVMQTDGNLVVYRDSDNYAVYNTGTLPGYPNYAMYLDDNGTLSLWYQNATTNAWQFRSMIADPYGYYVDGYPFLTTLSYWDVKVTSVNANGVEGGSIVATSTATALPPPVDTGGGG